LIRGIVYLWQNRGFAEKYGQVAGPYLDLATREVP